MAAATTTAGVTVTMPERGHGGGRHRGRPPESEPLPVVNQPGCDAAGHGHGHGRHGRGRCCRADSRMQTQLNIRLSVDEKALLERLAAEAGLTVSDYVRRRALGEDVR